MSDHVSAVFLEKDDEEHAPPTRLLKVGFFEDNESSVVFLNIGDYAEGTHSFAFESDEPRSFSVNRDDLLRALIALGAIDANSADLDD